MGFNESSESKMIPKFLAWGPVETSSVPIRMTVSGSVDLLEAVEGKNCMNSVLSSFSLSMLASIQDLISAIHDSSCAMTISWVDDTEQSMLCTAMLCTAMLCTAVCHPGIGGSSCHTSLQCHQGA